ncbi:hypothetical protein BKI52_03985 [marine bacterium AO1-C]|nr:hypothetical protein BKI52_03985 [marine bacterium AO1-C]
MKVIKIVIFLLFSTNICFGQREWTKAANFTSKGNVKAVGFSIGDRGYIATGLKGSNNNEKSTWEYDSFEDSWTQKADFNGLKREGAVAFVINDKAYVGTGVVGATYYKDFWQFDPVKNIWTKIADFGGTMRSGAVGFSINGKGYVGAGYHNEPFFGATKTDYKVDFWEYDPISDTWTKISSCPERRTEMTAFVVNNKAYVGSGTGFYGHSDLFWEFDPAMNSWTPKMNYPGGKVTSAIGFVLDGYGYVGTGLKEDGQYNTEFWVYDPTGNSWKKTDNYVGEGVKEAVSFVINDTAYVGSGSIVRSDFWQYKIKSNKIKAPSFLSVNTISNTQLTLNWIDNSDQEEKFEIYRSLNSTEGFVKIAEVAANITNYSDTELNYNINYFYKVKAVTGDRESTFSNIAGGTTSLDSIETPSLKVAAVSNSAIKLEWTDNSDNEISFQVYRRGGLIQELPANTTTFIDSNLAGGGYEYRIRAINNTNNSDFSSSLRVQTLDNNNTVKDALSGLTITIVANTQIKLDWKDNSIFEDKIEVYRASSFTDNFVKIVEVSANTTSYLDQGLDTNMIYSYKIKAVNLTTLVESEFSNTVVGNTSTSPINAPSALKIVAISSTDIRLDWVDNSDNETYFEVLRYRRFWPQFLSFRSSQIVKANTTTLVDSGLKPGHTYYYRVRAFNNSNASDSSLVDSALTLTTNPSLPNSPTDLNARLTESNQIELSWQDQADNETSFEIYRSVNNTNNYSQLVVLNPDIKLFTDQNVTEGNVYYYRVRAVNSTGTSLFSNEVNASVTFAINIALTASGQASNTIYLSWTTSNINVDGYNIERTVDETNGYVKIASVEMNTREYIDQGLELGKTYFYRVRAFKGTSFSQYSNHIGSNVLVTGINEILFQGIKVLSNPNERGVFQIKLKVRNHQDLKVELRNEQMQILPQGLVQKLEDGYQVSLNQYASGLYFLIFKTKIGQLIKRLIKL